MNTNESFDIVRGLADLGLAMEDVGNECWLCDYLPPTNPNYSRYIAKENLTTETHRPHLGREDCLIARAMFLANDINNDIELKG